MSWKPRIARAVAQSSILPHNFNQVLIVLIIQPLPSPLSITYYQLQTEEQWRPQTNPLAFHPQVRCSSSHIQPKKRMRRSGTPVKKSISSSAFLYKTSSSALQCCQLKQSQENPFLRMKWSSAWVSNPCFLVWLLSMLCRPRGSTAIGSSKNKLITSNANHTIRQQLPVFLIWAPRSQHKIAVRLMELEKKALVLREMWSKREHQQGKIGVSTVD